MHPRNIQRVSPKFVDIAGTEWDRFVVVKSAGRFGVWDNMHACVRVVCDTEAQAFAEVTLALAGTASWYGDLPGARRP